MTKSLLILILAASALSARKFLDDDPLLVEPKPRPVLKAENRKLSDIFDLFAHQFGPPGEHQPAKGEPIRARAVNSLGDPMEGAWWEKRHYFKPMSREDLIRGANYAPAPAIGKFTITGAKNEIIPGFVVVDSHQQTYFVKFDPLSNPEMATAADSISARFFYALGYHTPANYLIEFTLDDFEIRPGVTLADSTGRPREFTRRDLQELLLRVPKNKEGKFRATASAALPGKTIGPPRWFGTRSDDVNDIVPHEHRRDLRALHVVNAWLNHDDSRAINNVDILSQEGGIQHVRHYQLDFGSTLGSATQKANSPRTGVYFFSWKESAKLLFSLGTYVPYWALADYPNLPSVGRFEWKTFQPDRWVPQYPNPAFQNRLPDDEFWAAKQVMAFSDDDIKAIVSTGQFSNPKAADWVAECLIKRRDKIGQTYFAKVLPLDQFSIVENSLTWVDLGKKHNMYAPASIKLQWSNFNNETGKKTVVDGLTGNLIPAARDAYFVADLADPARTQQTISVYVHQVAGKPVIVGIDRAW